MIGYYWKSNSFIFHIGIRIINNVYILLQLSQELLWEVYKTFQVRTYKKLEKLDFISRKQL